MKILFFLKLDSDEKLIQYQQVLVILKILFDFYYSIKQVRFHSSIEYVFVGLNSFTMTYACYDVTNTSVYILQVLFIYLTFFFKKKKKGNYICRHSR